jgi:putative FmdB family regulatory protein
MPLYEYECRGCGKTFEALVDSSRTARCPACQGEDLSKLLSVFAVSTRGSGASSRTVAAGPCGTCGDPRGPGSCSMN